jgi:hypothetical protein
MRYVIARRTVSQTSTAVHTNDEFVARFEWYHEATPVAEFLANKTGTTIVILYKPEVGEWGVLQTFKPVADVDGVIPAGPDPMEPDYDGVPADTM